MLKSKIKALVTKENLNVESGFEIIYDSNAAKIMGGVEACPALSSCNTYTGDCPSLVMCGTYTDSPPPCSSYHEI